MNKTSLKSNPAKRRIFFGTGDENFQIFSVSQNPNDGSIYFSAPNFDDIQWLMPAIGENENPILLSYQASDQGKLSLHGSGVTHVWPFKSQRPNQFSIQGSELKSKTGEMLSVRHLFTIFPSEPSLKPNSPALARQSDWLMTTKQWHPYVIVFWAVPLTNISKVEVGGSFQEEDLEEIPPNGGWGCFNMSSHAIVWLAYRTKHMNKWPLNSQACYNNGYIVPVLIGTDAGKFRLEFHQPSYDLNDNQLSIKF
jgi:hypothetical protein